MVGKAPETTEGETRKAHDSGERRSLRPQQHDADEFFLLGPEENSIDSLVLFSLELGEM